MKRLSPFFALAIGATTVISAFALASDSSTDPRVQQLLQTMTLEEKVGQMTQLTLTAVSKDPASDGELQAIDPAKLRNALVDHHVGSLLNVTSGAFSIDHWHEILKQIQDVATQQTRLKIPVLYGIDAIHGATYTQGSTLFPQAIAMAATWNRDRVRDEGAITAMEVQASGLSWNFYPDLDVGRQPLWPRIYETYGEDTNLVSAMGSAYLEGHQGVATCLKHFVGYGFPWSGKDRTPSYLTERMLREAYLPPFEAAIRAGAQSIMVNSSEIDGVPGHANHHLLTDILRGELGFQGIAVSDWMDIERLYTRDRVASSPSEAVRIAVMAGVDLSMVPMDYSFYDLLIQLVKDGQVPMSRIDEATGRILRVKLALGLFEHPYPNAELKKNLAKPESTAANLRSAQEAITLLKNREGVLPLSKTAKVLVAGPNSNLLSVLNGGWTISWQGDQESLYPKDKPTILAAIERKVSADGQVVWAPDATSALKAVSNGVDVVVLCLGEKTYTETLGNIDDLTLPADQLELARQIENTGTPVVILLTEGRPRIIRPIVEGARGILMAYLPGMEGATAIADVLFGDINPSGKLPFTYPQYPNSLTPYDHTPMEEAEGNRFDPQFEFGFGLSYTHFAYSDLALEHDAIQVGDDLRVQVKITNTGQKAGKEVAQLFLTDLYASVSRPVKQLRGFEKVELNPGESKTVSFTLDPSDLSFVGTENRWAIEPSPFVVAIGPLSKTFELLPRKSADQY